MFEYERCDGGALIVNAEFSGLLARNGVHTARDLWYLEGESVKKLRADRGTERVILKGEGGCPVEVYVKRHLAPGVKEWAASLLRLRRPDREDAFNEWAAMIAFQEAGVPSMVPMAVARCPGGTASMALGITGFTRASDLAARLAGDHAPEAIRRRRALAAAIGRAASAMHGAGMAHQDLYLVHFFILEAEGDAIRLIDLQRVVMGKTVPRRLRIKDLAQLLFSATPFVSRTDMLRFWKAYAPPELAKDHMLLRAVAAKAARIRRRDDRKRALRQSR